MANEPPFESGCRGWWIVPFAVLGTAAWIGLGIVAWGWLHG